MKKENFNQNWLFCKEKYNENIEGLHFVNVCLPHTNEIVDLNYFDDEIYKYEYFYLKKFNVEKSKIPMRYFIEFDGVMAKANVYLNGFHIGEHFGGYTRFTFELTDKLKNGENEIIVEVDSTEVPEIPPFGRAVDYLTFGGIYREVTFITTPQNYISDITCVSRNTLKTKKALDCTITINANIHEKTSIKLELYNDKIKFETCIEEEVAVGDNTFKISLNELTDISLWDLENPNLYNIKVTYLSYSCVCSDIVKFGFRTAKFSENEFLLNEKEVKIFGLNRHQSFPFVGYAMPKRVQEKDADILKYELGLNLVRTSHYPQSQHFLNRCDEIGLLVFEEIPGWQFVGDEKWQDISLHNIREMIATDKNHPSIILWGVRINESIDNHRFYTKTNTLAKELDPTRQRGGVRCLDNSELLEDVYTMNDFVHNGKNEMHRKQQDVTGLSHTVPYLVTEFGGHMCPTKSYDGEERAIEHLRRHLEMHNDLALDKEICGGIGWCAFDYYTHNNFGSGDRICYHGVSDMFRIPKMAGLFYMSQRDPKHGFVLEAATRWTVGERDGGGLPSFMVLTNCDFVVLTMSGKEIGKYYPNKEKYAGLKFPPCIIDDVDVCWGGFWGSAEFIGYKNDKRVITKKYTHNPLPKTLYAKADDVELIADGSDATRIVVKALDEADNVLTFFPSPLTIEVTGQGELIGDSIVTFQGGVYAFWVKTTQEEGSINIRISNQKLGEKAITIQTKKS